MNIEQQIDAMIDELTDNPDEIKQAISEMRAASVLVDALQRARLDAGFSQRELAKAAGMKHTKVSRMESGDDNALRIGDVRQYLSGIGMTMHVSFDDESKPAAARIKQKVIEIGLLLSQLADLAEQDQNDHQLIDGINRFRGEVLFNFFLRYATTQPRIAIPPVSDPSPAPALRRTPSRSSSVLAPSCP